MKTIKVPIFTEEYKVVVAIGTVEELAKYVSNYAAGWNYEDAWIKCSETRGACWNTLPARHPLITLNGDLSWDLALATLPHEACHAVASIMDHLGIRDDNGGEFLAHGISAVMRHCLKHIPSHKKHKS